MAGLLHSTRARIADGRRGMPHEQLGFEGAIFEAKRQLVQVGKPRLPEGWLAPLENLVLERLRDFYWKLSEPHKQKMRRTGVFVSLDTSSPQPTPVFFLSSSEEWRGVRRGYKEVSGADMYHNHSVFNEYEEIKNLILMLEFAKLYGPEILSIRQRHFFNPEKEHLMALFNSDNLARAAGEAEKLAELPGKADSRQPEYPPVPIVDEIGKLARVHKCNILVIVPQIETFTAALVDLKIGGAFRDSVKGGCISEASVFARTTPAFAALDSGKAPGDAREKLLWELFEGAGSEFGIHVLYTKGRISKFLERPNPLNCIISIGDEPFHQHRLEIDKHPSIPAVYLLKFASDGQQEPAQ